MRADMRQFVLLLLLIISEISCRQRQLFWYQHFSTGSEQNARSEDFPFAATVRWSPLRPILQQDICSGTVVTLSAVVTACSCVAQKINEEIVAADPWELKVWAGSPMCTVRYDIYQETQVRDVHYIGINPRCSFRLFNHAFVMTKFPFRQTNKLIPVPVLYETPQSYENALKSLQNPYTTCKMAGCGEGVFRFGRWNLGNRTSLYPVIRRKHDIALADYIQCEHLFGPKTTDKFTENEFYDFGANRTNLFCGFHTDGGKPCYGDRGAGVICEGRLLGIFSQGFTCEYAERKLPIIFVSTEGARSFFEGVAGLTEPDSSGRKELTREEAIPPAVEEEEFEMRSLAERVYFNFCRILFAFHLLVILI